MRVEKRINEVVNRLNRTKVERKPDLKGTHSFVQAFSKPPFNSQKMNSSDKIRINK